jgi:ubiquinone biosynthesis monooxygenase Coq7
MDAFILAFDRALGTLSGSAHGKRGAPTPTKVSATPAETTPLTEAERLESVSLMRVNHAGEVAAQALYQGQALTSRSPELRQKLSAAADEELDHLAWTRQRVHALGGRTSVFDPLWYLGAFTIGAIAGVAGDRVSLGFLKATEEQVEAHLASHLNRLPATDDASRAIVEQMKIDEAQHAQMAHRLGALELPSPIQAMMRASAKVMTTLAAKG